MRVRHVPLDLPTTVPVELLDDEDTPIPIVSAFLQHLQARGYSPHTLRAYAYDLAHFLRFLEHQQLPYEGFRPRHAPTFLAYLHTLPTRTPVQRHGLAVCTTDGLHSARTRAPATINRLLAAVSSFYEYLILAGEVTAYENPMHTAGEPHPTRVRDRHRPFLDGIARQQPIRRVVRVKAPLRLPRPLADDHVQQLLRSLRTWRDKAMLLLMLQGGLRPGEVLNLHLEDIQYGRRRITIRYRTDHPRGVRTKSRTERVVDLHEPEALHAVSTYVMHERPVDAATSLVFLIGGHGKHRTRSLSYAALVKLFQRQCERLKIRTPWMTPHALRHTHATKMWEGGMRELALQKRLGHASPESTRMYTRVSDLVVVAEYRRALGEEEDA